MKPSHRTFLRHIAGFLLLFAWTAWPALAAEEAAPNPADTPVGTAFRWLNFALVFGAIAYCVRKLGTPAFRGHARSISNAIHAATDARAAGERELNEANEKLAAIDLAIQDLRRTAAGETAAEANRIRALAQSEAERIGQAARAEIAAAGRAARLELRGVAARLATDRAATLVSAQMNAATEGALFRTFVEEIERTAR
jgi:F0F1-type ATP synthase membrane subunit b/b'